MTIGVLMLDNKLPSINDPAALAKIINLIDTAIKNNPVITGKPLRLRYRDMFDHTFGSIESLLAARRYYTNLYQTAAAAKMGNRGLAGMRVTRPILDKGV